MRQVFCLLLALLVVVEAGYSRGDFSSEEIKDVEAKPGNTTRLRDMLASLGQYRMGNAMKLEALRSEVRDTLRNKMCSEGKCRKKRCRAGHKPRRRHFTFIVEQYYTMGPACGDCPNNRTACFNNDCVTADGVERAVIATNGKMPGPIIEVCRGDTVVVDVVNRLLGSEMAIHWHGFTQKGTPFMDGVPHVTQCTFGDGSQFRYEFVASEMGTHFWYSDSCMQRVDGLVGALIVRCAEDPSSWMHDVDNHTVILQEWHHQPTYSKYPGSSDPEIRGQKPNAILINGRGNVCVPQAKKEGSSDDCTLVPFSEFRVHEGKGHRFRIINAGGLRCPLQFQIEKHSFTVIAADGFPVKPVSGVNTLVIFPGERYDVVLTANQRKGAYWILVKALGACSNDHVYQRAVLIYKNSKNETPKSENPGFEGYPLGLVINPLNKQCVGLNDSPKIAQSTVFVETLPVALPVVQPEALFEPLPEAFDPEIKPADVPEVPAEGILVEDVYKAPSEEITVTSVAEAPVVQESTLNAAKNNDTQIKKKKNKKKKKRPTRSAEGSSPSDEDSPGVCAYELCSLKRHRRHHHYYSKSDSSKTTSSSSKSASHEKNHPHRKFVINFNIHTFSSADDVYAQKSAENNRYYVAGDGALVAGQIDGVSLALPASILLEDHDVFSQNKHISCRKGKIHQTCLNMINIVLGEVVDIILVHNASTSTQAYPFHLHGYKFEVLYQGHSMEEAKISSKKNSFPSLRDTVVVPPAGVARIRFTADNPGVWLLKSMYIFQKVTGMALAFKVGHHSDYPPLPKDFPTCGNYKPDEPLIIFEESGSRSSDSGSWSYSPHSSSSGSSSSGSSSSGSSSSGSSSSGSSSSGSSSSESSSSISLWSRSSYSDGSDKNLDDSASQSSSSDPYLDYSAVSSFGSSEAEMRTSW